MQAEIRVKEVNAAEKLVQETAECRSGDGGPDCLGVVMYDLLYIRTGTQREDPRR